MLAYAYRSKSETHTKCPEKAKTTDQEITATTIERAGERSRTRGIAQGQSETIETGTERGEGLEAAVWIEIRTGTEKGIEIPDVDIAILNPARLHAIVVPKIGMRIVITNQGQAGGGLGRGQGVILVITPVTVRVKMRDGGGNGRNERENARKRRKKNAEGERKRRELNVTRRRERPPLLRIAGANMVSFQK